MTSTRAALLVSALALLAGCSEKSKAGPGPSLSASYAEEPAPRYVREEIVTEGGEAALARLDQAIAKSRLDGAPANVRTAELLAARFAQLRRTADLVDSVALFEAVAQASTGTAARRARIRSLTLCGKYREALDLDPEEPVVRFELLFSLGRYDEAAKVLDAADLPGARRLRAELLSRQGKVEDSEALWIAEEASYPAASTERSFDLGDLYFARGSMWEREGDLAKATALYRAAVRVDAVQVHAATHLAALLTPAEGEELLAPLVQQTDDPDLAASLGAFREMRKDGAGKADSVLAADTYEAMLRRFPDLYAERAGWFFLTVKSDPERALELAKIATAAAPTSESFELGLAAILVEPAPGPDRCDLFARARTLSYPSPGLTEMLRRAGDCSP